MTDKKTETQQKGTMDQLQGVRHPLAVVRPQPQLEPLPMTAIDYNDPKVIEAIKAEICPSGITETEFRIFIDKCRQSGLNPLLGECFCVPRWSNVKVGPDEWKLVKKNQFQAAETGMAARAEKFDGYRGIRFGMVHEMDTCEINTGTGEVKHSYNLTGDRGAPVAAWAQVIRDGYFFSPDVIYLKDYEQRKKGNGKNAGELTEMWQKPAIMLPKCARAAAFRRAFPTPFSGVYAREEMRDDDERADLETDAGGPVDQRPTTDKLADRARQAKQADASRPRAESVPASKATVDVVPEKPKEPAPSPPKGEAPKTMVGVAELKAELRRHEIPFDELQLEKSEAYAAELAGKVAEARKAAEEKLAKAAEARKAENAAAGAAKPEEKVPPPDRGPLMVFDLPDRKTKGDPVESLSGPELLIAIAWAEQKISSLKTDNKSTAEQKATRVRGCIEAIKVEQKKREDKLKADSEAPEPGADLDVD